MPENGQGQSPEHGALIKRIEQERPCAALFVGTLGASGAATVHVDVSYFRASSLSTLP